MVRSLLWICAILTFCAVLVLLVPASVEAGGSEDLDAKAALALAVAVHTTPEVVPVVPVVPVSVKTCPCSDQCSCGCNAGLPCDCAARARATVTPIYPVPTYTPIYTQPVYRQRPSYLPPSISAFPPLTSRPVFQGRSSGC